jgi:hypothetical protein
MTDSGFLNNLIGTHVRVLCKDPVDCGVTPVLILREISPLGIVGEGGGHMHFFPWTEVVEITACPEMELSDDLALAVFADSEP